MHTHEMKNYSLALCVIMDFGSVTFMKSKFCNNNIAIFQSQRKPGFSYKFALQSGNRYRCSRCLGLQKQRYIVIRNGTVFGRKHPEDDHHPDCEPIAETE